MGEVETAALCAKHPDKAAIAQCDHCGKPLCSRCRVEDVAAEEVFCSHSCRDTHPATGTEKTLSEVELIEGLHHPILEGWKLWGRSMPTLAIRCAPLAVLMVLIMVGVSEPPEDLSEPTSGEEGYILLSCGAAILFLAVFLFGFAYTQVILSQRYSGHVQGDAFLWTIKRFIPWIATLAIYLTAVFVGMFALLVPGIWLGVRLFWVDEFVLVHRAGPIQAIKESWQLTDGNFGAIFGFQFVAGWASWLVFACAGIVIGIVTAVLGEPDILGPIHLTVMGSSLVFLVIFLAYGALHAPELVYLYGMRADRSRSLARSNKILGLS